MNGKLLFILLDAFRGDYINAVDTPFLHKRTQEGAFAKKLKTVSGFTQRTAICTGSRGDQTGMFTMFTFDREKSPFRFLAGNKQTIRFEKQSYWWDRLPKIKGMWRLQHLCAHLFKGGIDMRRLRMRNEFRSWVENEAKKYADNAPLAHIPMWMLPEIGVSEDNRPIYEPGALPQETIFDVFCEKDIEYKYLMYPLVNCQDDAVITAFLDKQNSSAQILIGQFSDSDLLVHQYGPKSYERRKVTGEIDRKLRELDAHFGPDTTWIIIGDHGMADITEEINVPAAVRELEMKHRVEMGRDYLLFLDSTLARFLWKNETGKRFLEEVETLPALLEKGVFIDEQLARENSIPIHDRRYGDLIWRANVGVLIFPDYFHDLRTHNKGMHGYDSNHDAMKGFFLAFGPGIEAKQLGQVDLIDVCPSICKAAGVRAPRHNQGKCLI